MDVVLEVLDTLFLDRVWATVLPASTATACLAAVQHAAAAAVASIRGGTATAGNATFSSMRELPTGVRYQYHPSTQYLQLQPSEWAYLSAWPRDHVLRQAISLYLITWLFGLLIYLVCASLSYVFIFDKTAFAHPRFLKHQVRQEIRQAMEAVPIMSALTVPFFVAEVRGYTKLYDRLDQGPGWAYTYLQFPLFIAFTDFCIYWIHRGLHLPVLYRRLHKAHHKWIMPTPYASHAFHPVDGFVQSIPYHVFPLLFPLQKFAYIALFVFINVWTVFIHDGEYVSNSPIINGAACHTMHHLYFHYNYGQFTTLWDRLGGSYRHPSEELFGRETKLSLKETERQLHVMETVSKAGGGNGNDHDRDRDHDRRYALGGYQARDKTKIS
ncbi:MAG: c-5 sterol desaturase [Phylliscum demangeonii]|nr:MAG: c-5 sterol desaturase [Phylliscum demangeonii]